MSCDPPCSRACHFLDDPIVRETQHAQRCPLQELQPTAQQRAEEAAAGDEVVVGAEDDRALDITQGQPGEELLEVTAGVDAHMRREPVAPGARKVINKGLVAKAVLSTPENAVRLERV